MAQHTRLTSFRLDIALFKDLVDYASKKNINQTDALHVLLTDALNNEANLCKKQEIETNIIRKVALYLGENERWSNSKIKKTLPKIKKYIYNGR